jgi:hypothetical protein
MNAPMNKAYLDAMNVYAFEACPRTFEEDLIAHLMHGFVFSRPDIFLMGRPVISTASREDIVNPWYKFKSADCDCWHVYLCAGNAAKALDFVPFKLPLVSFERGNKLRFLRFTSITRLLGS